MESVPKKRARSGLKKRSIFLILACAAVLAGIGAYFLRPQAPAPPVSLRTEPLYLLSRPADEIEAIAVTPREGDAYALVQRETGLRLLGEEDTALREWLTEDLLSVAASLPVQDVAAEEDRAPSLGDFGLEPPLTTVTVTYRDGERVTLRFGDATPGEEDTRYCLRAGDGRVFTVMNEESRLVLYERDYLRAFEQPKIDASLLDRVDVAGDIVFGAYYTQSGWQMDAPFRYPLSTARTDQLLKSIEGMGFETLLGDRQSLNLADYGLDHPALTVTLTQAPTVVSGENAAGETVTIPQPSAQYVLEIGAETGKSGVYLSWRGRVFKASNFVLGFWKALSVEDMLLRQPVNLLVNDLNRVTLEYGDHKASYEVRMVEAVTQNNQIATDEYGSVRYDCAVRRAGEQADMDAEAFLSWYVRLASLSPAGDLPPGYTPGGEPRARIILENDRLTRVIDFCPWDALHDAIVVDGVARFYVESAWLDSVKDTP